MSKELKDSKSKLEGLQTQLDDMLMKLRII